MLVSPTPSERPAPLPGRPRPAAADGPNLAGFARSVAATAVSNVIVAAMGAVAGIVIARALGPTVRGEYAAIVAWFGAVLTLGEFGQSAATTFFVAQNSVRVRDYLATSRTMMVASGLVALTIGILAAPLLAQGDGAMALGYRLMFATCLAGFVGASYTFALLAANLSRYNAVRIAQPAVFVAGIMALQLGGRLSLMTALASLSISIVVQAALAYHLCHGQQLTGGRTDRALARPMTRYGLSQLAANATTQFSTYLDPLVLSIAVAPADLGRYAVAASLTMLAAPAVSAVGNVAFPRLAARVLSDTGMARLQRHALAASAGTAIAVTVPVACLASWLVPVAFGPAFAGAVPLVLLLAPGGIFRAWGQVCGDLLRGRGRPLAVAWAQGAAAVVMAVLLAILLPAFGVIGAAIASSAAAGLAPLLMVRALRKQ